MKTLIVSLLTFLSFSAMAQTKAITDTGKEVWLHNDGTWKYVNEADAGEETSEEPITTNSKDFKKPLDASFEIKSNKFPTSVWINPKTWSFKKAVNNPSAEYELHTKDGDLYAMLITEKIEIPLLMLKSVALSNAKSVAPDIEVTDSEYRMVNGKKMLMLQMTGTTQGIKFTYYGYYYSDSRGTIQFVTYSSNTLMKQYKATAENLLNGMVIND